MLFKPSIIKCSNGDCPNTFIQKEKKNIYCSRKCSSAAWNRNKRANKIAPSFPLYRCSKCGELFQLTFDPTLDFDGSRLINAKCDKCSSLKSLCINVFDEVKSNE